MTDYKDMSDAEKKKEDWMNSKWRPMMGWSYMATCICDFVLFPVLWSILQAVMHVTQMTQWQPLTLQGAGLYHLAMGAVLGIAALGRTQEKIAGANNGGAASTSPGGFAAPSAPTAGFGAPASGFGAPAAAPAAPSGFGSSSFGSAPKPVAAPAASVGFSSTGKPMPAPAPEPEL